MPNPCNLIVTFENLDSNLKNLQTICRKMIFNPKIKKKNKINNKKEKERPTKYCLHFQVFADNMNVFTFCEIPYSCWLLPALILLLQRIRSYQEAQRVATMYTKSIHEKHWLRTRRKEHKSRDTYQRNTQLTRILLHWQKVT